MEIVIDILSFQGIVKAAEILNTLSDNPAERTLRDDLTKLKKLVRITLMSVATLTENNYSS